MSTSNDQDRLESLTDLKYKALVNERKHARGQAVHEKTKTKLQAAEKRIREYEETITVLKRQISLNTSNQPGAQRTNTDGEEPAAKSPATTGTLATKRSQSDEGSVKWRETAQGSSALRDTRPSVTNNVYNILNSHKTIIYTNRAYPGDNFVPTPPPRKKSTAAAPAAKNKPAPAPSPAPKPAPDFEAQPGRPEVEEPTEAAQEPTRPPVSRNTIPGLIEGVKYEIEEIIEDIAELAACKVLKSMYNNRCLRQERGKACGRNSCKYTHEDQLYLYEDLIKTLYANAKVAKEVGA